MARDYKSEYRKYHSKPEQKKNRASRNAARRLYIRKKGKKALQGKDIDHKDRNPRNNSPSNLRIKSKKSNRSNNQ